MRPARWKWLVGLGCLASLLCAVSMFAAIYFGVSKLIVTSEPCEMAMEKVRSSEEVKETLGLPLEAGFGVRGTLKSNNDTGYCDFTVPLEGPKGKGDLHVVGESSSRTWTLTTIDVITSEKTIQLVVQ